MELEINKLNFKNEDYVIFAVSGGPDSMAMLDMFKDSNFHIVVAHVNYRKRLESDEEQRQVEKYCKKNNLIFETKTVTEKHKGNFQTWAREYRYNFFKELYKKYKAKAVYIAHNLDDFLETYYIQKERRTQTRCYGIAQDTEIDHMKIFRPCLYVLKKDLLSYCMENNVYYSIDCSNLSDDYLRNRIRHHKLSKLTDKQKNNLKVKILKENESLKSKFALVDDFYNKYVHHNRIDINLFREDDEIAALVLFKVVNRRNHSMKAVKDIVKQVKSGRSNLLIKIDKHRNFVKEYDKIFIKRASRSDQYEYVLEKPREMEEKNVLVTYFGDGRHQLKLSKSDFPLTIRSPRKDDVIELEHGSKKLSRVFIDNKVGRERRKDWPIVLNSQGLILLVCGLTKHYNYSKKKVDYDYELYFYERNRRE